MSLTTADFLVGPVIGQGAFGRVLFGKHKETNRHVAIKVVDQISLRKRHTLQQAVLQEQRLLRSQLKGLDHVVDLWASFYDQECLYMVMECCMGGTLLQLIERRHSREDWLPSQQAALYGRQILQGLQEIHSRRVIHADLSPSNILLTDRGRVKICDFGCAIDMNESSGSIRHDDNDEEETDHGQFMARGTCDYASPEILRGKPPQELTIAADIWSFGCILFCLVQGESPFCAASEALAVQRVLEYANESDVDARFHLLFADAPLPPAWQRLVAPMLKPDAKLRLGTDDGADDWHLRTQENSVWYGLDPDNEPVMLPDTPEWLASLHDDDLLDGKEGWSAFLV